MIRIFVTLTLLLIISKVSFAIGQINYDETKVGTYKLPDALIMNDGKEVTTKKQWQERRAQIIDLFKQNVYGDIPKDNLELRYKVIQENDNALNGKAIEKQAVLYIGKTKVNLLIYIPNQQKKNYPIFLGYNFCGNQSVTNDPNILINKNWGNPVTCLKPTDPKGALIDNHFTAQSKGYRSSRFDLEDIINNGYGLVTAYYGDIAPDNAQKLYDNVSQSLKNYKDYSAISLWAWGLINISNGLKNEPLINQNKIIVFGHSRLGKTALWAAALDQNFAMVISNDSGTGGASLSKRNYGETLYSINTEFPYWFSKNFKKYNNNTQALPVDQHMLLDLIAPRPLYVASAEDDQWADPNGAFLAAKATSPVYKLFGEALNLPKNQPAVNKPVIGIVSYHIRSGGHDLTTYDWQQYIKAANLFVNF
ncbi:glucuronyl esterase domain-containing protein [Francisella salina]|uniref:Glycoprotein gp2 n=1 Tax=Francisella salina TaxID=573569 RepID=A0ABM5MC86_FRAST|nr:hypothetical protein [Francisella salina]AEI36865.1 Glycoprotein gp2 [Francisella salina]